jgi:glucan phosphoethanolaminetransferase (alkaline phosphatase superfamily)
MQSDSKEQEGNPRYIRYFGYGIGIIILLFIATLITYYQAMYNKAWTETYDTLSIIFLVFTGGFFAAMFFIILDKKGK